MKKQTYTVQCSFGLTWKDYYVEASCERAAQINAKQLFVKEFRVASRFLKAVC